MKNSNNLMGTNNFNDKSQNNLLNELQHEHEEKFFQVEKENFDWNASLESGRLESN